MKPLWESVWECCCCCGSARIYIRSCASKRSLEGAGSATQVCPFLCVLVAVNCCNQCFCVVDSV
ncbi:uncharacterized protein B0I36DRAFT_312755 [Microdochium trichocladiopsis]|uniref:Uncharacterized protein n=1 Tax=Microdochium trichocladiopsis TaxID=1682393 RepID=A0A9P9BUW2_9PEZI|nr:uncharacterized protein B0I36DRAFT_312755 [Microdochium trichocladiopsis]KAH7041396.1 hypothetical protein B0I36DRAFT_312755 [Microdochium trichocladiopsis]